ncbi:hypothetical protein F4V43_10965 [Paenibacillus spiritus]|uniref:Uncharacterized protein n=1 Tax=Paenibacillus spiritus TaxID=2496557 RepID=A0A5J5G8K1_9BACL|nr:hypothetical protein [Paenibacillus spiritus]KAA9003932.1 hypothetical protein F4V43_10965 [Paenibacillus spiritus]
MRKRTAALLLLLTVLMAAGGYAVHTRTGPDRYEKKGNLLWRDGRVYRLVDVVEDSERKSIGNTVGIAVEGRRTWTDWVFPTWIMEFKQDPGHERLFVRGLMDNGAVYRLEQKE